MKSLYTFLIIWLVVLSFAPLYAQQESHFSQYYQNPYIINPALGGLTRTIQMDVGYRNQWVGVEGTPQTFYITGHSEINIGDKKRDVLEDFNPNGESIFAMPSNSIGRNKHVVGGRILSDWIGPFNKSSIMASYAYHIRFSRAHMMSAGLSAGWTNFGINSSKVILVDQDDAEYDNFFGRNANQNIFDINLGIAYYAENFQFGFSSAQLLQNNVQLDQIMTQNNHFRHFYWYGMYQHEATDEFILEPHFLLQTARNIPMSLNIGTRILFERKYWANVAYRLGDAINVGVGLNFGSNLRFGYSYDFGTGPFQVITNNVHELHLGIIIGKNKSIETN